MHEGAEGMEGSRGDFERRELAPDLSFLGWLDPCTHIHQSIHHPQSRTPRISTHIRMQVTGPNSADMVMLRVAGPDAVAAFPKSKWGIPEPPLPEPLEKERDDGTYTGRMDLVVVPGVAFDAQCRRLGHGKGYYGTCLCECVCPCRVD